MKKKILLFCTVFILLILQTATAGAEEKTGVTVYGDGIKISGARNESGAQIIAAVFEGDFNDEVTDDNISSNLVALTQAKSDNSGAFEFFVPLSYSLDSGVYTVEVSTSGNFDAVVRETFYFLSGSDIADITEKFNSAQNGNKIKELCEAYVSQLNIIYDGIFEDALSESDVYSRMILERNEKVFSNTSDIKQAFDRACLMSALSAAKSSDYYVTLFMDNQNLLNVNFSDLSDDETYAVAEILMKKDFETASDFEKVFEECVCAAKFNLASRGDVEELINQYDEYLYLPSEYSKSGSAAKEKRLSLYKKIENENDFSSYDDISGFIDDFYDNYKGTSNSGSGSGGSGGGSGKTTGFVQITADDVTSAYGNGEGTSQLTPATNFKDLTGYEWALEAIETLANDKIILGVGENRFEPHRAIKREEFVKLVVEAFDIDAKGDVHFSDVPYDAWYRPYVISACNADIIQGTGDGIFGSGNEITRQEMAVIMHRIIVHKNLSAEKSGAIEFSDSENIAAWAKDAIDVMTSNKILNGVSEMQFAPAESVNRAMAAKAVYSLREFVENAEVNSK